MEDQDVSSAHKNEAVSSEAIENECETVSRSSSASTSGPHLPATTSVSPVPPGISHHHCGACEKIFTLLADYLSHRVTDHAGQQRGMHCELCGTAYARQVPLREHYKKKHRITFNNKQEQTSMQAKPARNGQTAKRVKSRTAEDRICSVSSDERSQDIEEECTKTIHVIITKTEEELTNSDMLRDGDVKTAGESKDGQNCEIPGGGEDRGVGSGDGRVCEVREDRENEGHSDTLATEMNNTDNKTDQTDDVEKIDIDREFKHESENMMDLDLIEDTHTVVRKVSESGDNSALQAFDESEDFHFVLLKNMINGNSFKYSKDRFQCLHCDFKSYWRNSMSSHMKQHHKDMMSIHQFIEIKPPIQSAINNTALKGQADQTIMKMSDYVASVHQKKTTRSGQYRIRRVEKQDLPGHFPCPKCDKEFNRLRYLRKHMLVHKTDKKYLCDECGKAFKTRSYLKTHYRTHKERMFKCSQCNFSSSVNAVIHAHRQLHNDGSVICDVCGFAYADRSTLKKHMMVHDPDRPFPCTFPGCTWRFKTKVMCLAHYNAHTTEGKFRCSVCGYVFRHKHHLQRHQSKMHGITNMTNVTIVENEKKEEKDNNETSDVPDTVNLIVNSDFSRDQLQSALENGQLVIATDSEGNPINYEVADITMNVTYHTLLEDESELGDTQTILHVATIDSHDDTVL